MCVRFIMPWDKSKFPLNDVPAIKLVPELLLIDKS